MRLIVLTAGLVAILTACSQESSEQKGHPLLMAEVSYTQRLKTLSSDAFEGRQPGTKGEQMTIDYIVKAYSQMGLQPLGEATSFEQKVTLVSNTLTNSPTLNVQGGGFNKDYTYKSDQVTWSPKQRQETVSIKDSDLVFVGYGIHAPERGWNDYAGIDVKGKTVLILINDPGYATQDPAMFNGNAMTYYGRWDYKFAEAARQGAAAALIIHDTEPAAYGWTTVSNSWSQPQFDTLLEDGGASRLLVEGWVQKHVAEDMLSAAGMDLAGLMTQAKTPDFKASALNLKASVEIEMQSSAINSTNAVGYLKGTKRPDEYILYMAHWDHLGMVQDEDSGETVIFNGAFDNATGTAGLLELATAFTNLPEKPERSVIFMSVTAEEQGLLGSAYYAANPLVPHRNIVAGLNMDGLNPFGPTSDMTIVGYGNSELDTLLAKAAESHNKTLTPDPEAEKGYFYRSDHFELAKAGVPMIYPNMGAVHRTLGRQAVEDWMSRYLRDHYHQSSDDYSQIGDITGALEDLAVYFDFGLDLANSDVWPNWADGSEFKAARDRDRAGENS